MPTGGTGLCSIALYSFMDNDIQPETPPAAEAVARKKPLRTLKEFLESTPPDFAEEVSQRSYNKPSTGSLCLNEPDLQLHCDSNKCDGVRTYYCTSSDIYLENEKTNYKFMTYACRNCRAIATVKTFALAIKGSGVNGTMQKIGELPPFGPPTPYRVFKLIGEDYRELFLQGRRAENKGLGIGAYAYYRRIVEHQKGRIIDEIRKVAEKLGESDQMLKALTDARTENQFAKVIDMVKGAIPKSLLIDGHNPLLLLHDALSDGIHEFTDDECLRLATSIRIVLIELAERISTALKDHAELKTALGELLSRKRK
jgi:hypothetical protein